MITTLSRALAARAELVDAGAPSRVISAADVAIDCHKCNVPPPAWARDILFNHARQQAAQNRYGKAKA
ncbi:MAG: hypothetical protein ACK57J_19720 [Rubrivivax sp.]